MPSPASDNKHGDQRVTAMQLVASGAVTEDHGMLGPSEQFADAFKPGLAARTDW